MNSKNSKYLRISTEGFRSKSLKCMTKSKLIYRPVVEEEVDVAAVEGLMEDPAVSSVRPLTRSVDAVRKKELRLSLSTLTSPW